ncbi:MAG: methylisocitrate lyase [Desulfurococcales archaeon]|nr:methylisocitrate lyase [Desulfurococcales archaeon]
MAFLYRSKPVEGPAKRLSGLIEKRKTIPVIGVFNPISALLAESIGFDVIYLSGAALTGSLAMPDLGLITLTELVMSTRYITRVTSLPLIVDTDTGFGETINVQRTVMDLADAGAAAIQIEDQVLPKKCGHLKGKKLAPAEEMVRKIIAAKRIAKDKMLVIARTDARGVEGLDEALRRAKLYEQAGADIIFPEALTSEEEFREFSKKINIPLLANMTEFGRTPYFTVEDFSNWGYKLVLFPVTLFRVSLGAMRDALKTIKSEGTQRGILDKMMTRQEFYELIGYYEYEKEDNSVYEFSRKVS